MPLHFLESYSLELGCGRFLGMPDELWITLDNPFVIY